MYMRTGYIHQVVSIPFAGNDWCYHCHWNMLSYLLSFSAIKSWILNFSAHRSCGWLQTLLVMACADTAMAQAVSPVQNTAHEGTFFLLHTFHCLGRFVFNTVSISEFYTCCRLQVVYEDGVCWLVWVRNKRLSGPRLNIKTVLSTYGDFHVKDKTAVRTSYL